MSFSKPIMHGRDHRPGGSDPSQPGPWHNVGDPDEPPFLSGGSNVGGDSVPLRFRIGVGNLNIVTPNELTVVQYNEKQLDIEGDVNTIGPGYILFQLPAAYRDQFDRPYHSHDQDGNYIPCRIYVNGDFVWGTA